MAETQEETSGSDCPASNTQPEPHSRNVHVSENGEDGVDDGVAGDLLAIPIVVFRLNLKKQSTKQFIEDNILPIF